jgi:hypothetical protein
MKLHHAMRLRVKISANTATTKTTPQNILYLPFIGAKNKETGKGIKKPRYLAKPLVCPNVPTILKNPSKDTIWSASPIRLKPNVCPL